MMHALSPVAPAGSAWSGRPMPYAMRSVVSQDVDEHAANLSAWGQTYDQLSAGAFSGSLTEVWTNDAQVFRETTSC